jgi:hypothetical protein
MMQNAEICFRFSIAGETFPPSNAEEKKMWLGKIANAFSNFSDKASVNIIDQSSDQKPMKIEIKMPQMAFSLHMKKMACFIENEFKKIKNFGRYEVTETDSNQNHEDNLQNKPFLTLLTEFTGMKSNTTYFVNETYRFLGKKIYFEPLQDGLLAFFGTLTDFEDFVNQIKNLI